MPQHCDQDRFRAGALRADVARQVGSHVIVDLYGASGLDDKQAIERCLRQCVEKAGATLLHMYLHPFATNGGVSGVAVLAESHISIHTWPEHRYAAVDVFMCGKAQPQVCVEVMREAFAPERCVVQELPRGGVE
jgi:S-adenosylmethionine decarboxylase